MGIDENFKSPYLGNYKEFRTFEGKRAVFIGVKEHDAAIRFSLSLTVFEIWLLTLFRTKCNRVSRPILSVVDPKKRGTCFPGEKELPSRKWVRDFAAAASHELTHHALPVSL